MATLQDFRNERLKKLEKLRALGVNPYPSKTDRTVKNSEVKLKFEEFEGQKANQKLEDNGQDWLHCH